MNSGQIMLPVVSVQRVEAIEKTVVRILRMMANHFERTSQNQLLLEVDELLAEIGQKTTAEYLADLPVED